MEVLDEKGRLFGSVNVIDAVVVVVAASLVLAGAGLVLGVSNPSPTGGETIYVTFETTEPEATALERGEVQVGGAQGNLRDVYASPRGGSATDFGSTGTTTHLRIALNATLSEGQVRVNGNTLWRGNSLRISDNRTQTTANLVEFGQDPTFETGNSTVTIESVVRSEVAEAVTPGDTQKIGDSTVARVRASEQRPLNESFTALRTRVTLRTMLGNDTATYGGHPVRLGRNIWITTSDYQFDGEIVAVE